MQMKNETASNWPAFTEEEANAVKDVLLSNKVNYWTGDECKNFEVEFARYTGSKFAIALSNGTVALELALRGLKIGEESDHEVLVTPRSFIASVSCVINVGAKPVFVDLDPVSGNLCPNAIEQAITQKTKAILVVHVAGWPCDMDEIMKIAKKYSLKVIEDCAQAHGALYKDRPVGSIGHIGCWSFCQDKIMTTGGEGGMLVTDDEEVWRIMWSYKDHGKSFSAVFEKNHPPGFRWVHESIGTNFRMTEMQAAIGRLQLKKLDTWNEIRTTNADALKRAFQGAPKASVYFSIPEFRCSDSCLNGAKKRSCNKNCRHAYYRFYVYVNTSRLPIGWSRERIIAELTEDGVKCFPGSCSEIYLEKAFENLDCKPRARLAVARTLGAQSIMFLVHPTISQGELKQIARAVSSLLANIVNDDANAQAG